MCAFLRDKRSNSKSLSFKLSIHFVIASTFETVGRLGMARKWVHWTNEKLVIFSIKPSSHPFWEINSFDHTQILHTQHPDDRSLDAQRAESTRLRPFCGLGRGRFTERIDATRSLSAYLTNNYTPAKSQKLKLLYAIKPDCRHIFDADVRNATMCDTSNSQKTTNIDRVGANGCHEPLSDAFPLALEATSAEP